MIDALFSFGPQLCRCERCLTFAACRPDGGLGLVCDRCIAESLVAPAFAIAAAA